MYDGNAKRVFDLLVLLLAHIILAPVLLALWIVIPLLIWMEDRGPVFYRQLRAGKDGVPFWVLKFRTMVLHADEIGPVWTAENDSRMTRVGRILRRTALDEIPETLAIWTGKMTLVGPRALALGEQRLLEQRIPGFEERLRVRPGLTGMAQVYNKADGPELKLRYDLEYIERMGVWLDIKLLLLSVYSTAFARWDSRVGKEKVAEEARRVR